MLDLQKIGQFVLFNSTCVLLLKTHLTNQFAFRMNCNRTSYSVAAQAIMRGDAKDGLSVVLRENGIDLSRIVSIRIDLPIRIIELILVTLLIDLIIIIG